MKKGFVRRVTAGWLALGVALGAAIVPVVGFGVLQPAGASVPPPAPHVTSLVPITDATMELTPTTATISATVKWNEAGRFGPEQLTEGILRVMAINGTTRLPTVITSMSWSPVPTDGPVKVVFPTVTELALVHHLAWGNRVVITATQHHAIVPGKFNSATYVTVHQIQPGPSRGPVGRLDCSERPLVAPTTAAGPFFNNCDFTGAMLINAIVSTPGIAAALQQTDFTGAELNGALLNNANMAGAWLSGAVLTGAQQTMMTNAGGFAPSLVETNTYLNSVNMFHDMLAGANFAGSTTTLTTFSAANLTRSSFLKATMKSTELTFANLTGADLRQITATSPAPAETSLFMADLTSASLAGSVFLPDGPEFQWEILCNTTLENGTVSIRDR